MFEQFRLTEVLVQYKQNFVSKLWGEEKYKWEAVKWFQDNWDVNAPDFAEMLFFSNVDTIDPTTIRWSAIRFQRNNNTYRMLISLCQLILEGMLLTLENTSWLPS